MILVLSKQSYNQSHEVFLIINLQEIQQLTARDEKWVPSYERVKISPSNVRLKIIVPQKEETFQVVIDVIKNSTCFKAFTIFADKCIVDAEVFRKILYICPRLEGEEFTEVQNDDATLTFLIDLGYKGSQGKKTADTPVADVDVPEEFDSEPARKRTASRRVVKKKVTISAADNIIPDPDVALELGKSISLTEAAEEEVKGKSIDTSQVPKKVSSDSSQKLKGVQSLTPEEQEAADIMQALKESKKSSRRQPSTRGSSKGTGRLLGVPDESTVISTISSEGTGTKPGVPDEEKEEEEKKDDDKSIDLEMTDDEETKDEFIQGDEQVNDDEDEVMSDAEVEESEKGLVTTKEKVQKKNDVKARSMLLMALPNEHLMTFNQYKDAKTLFAAIQTRFGGNEATKKTKKTSYLKQRMRTLRNKPDLDTISFDDLYNNFKIVEQEVKGTASSSLSSSSQNIAFVSSPSSTNEVNTAYGVSTTNTQVSPASTQVSTANLSDATVYAFLASQPNMSQLVYEDLEQIHEDELEEMDLKWQLALLSMRTRRFFQKTSKNITIYGSDPAGYDKSKVECFNYHKMGHFGRECRGPKNQDSRNRNQDSSGRLLRSVEEQLVFYKKNEPEFEGYGPKTSKSISKDISNEIRESSNATLVEELVSDDKLEKKTVFPTLAKIEVTFVMYNKDCFRCGIEVLDHVHAGRPKAVNTARPNSAVVNVVRANQGHPQKEDQGYVDSGCSRHMTGNMSYLSDFKEFDGGYVTFGGGAKGGKITGKGTLKTGKLDFEDVYFVKEL
ncbi:ribonuclease H-like domain-containing protein [Tanacetum coccineum]